MLASSTTRVIVTLASGVITNAIIQSSFDSFLPIQGLKLNLSRRGQIYFQGGYAILTALNEKKQDDLKKMKIFDRAKKDLEASLGLTKAQVLEETNKLKRAYKESLTSLEKIAEDISAIAAK